VMRLKHMCWGRKAALGKSSCWRQILKSDFFKVRSVELRSADIIVVPGSIALGFISEDKPITNCGKRA
jgi:hypothetical protein